jgi:hypothetical protein
MSFLKKVVGGVSNALGSVAKAIDTGARKAGDKIVETKVGKVVADTVKTGLVVPNASYESIFSKDLVKIQFDTKAGAFAGGINKIGIESGHDALKAYANNVTGGYAEKLHVAAVDGYDPNKPKEQVFKTGFLSKTEGGIRALAPVVGGLAADVLKSKPQEAQPGTPPSGGDLTDKLGFEYVPPKPNNMGFFQNAGAFLQTDIGKSVQGVLGGVVNNLLTPKQKAPSTVPQQQTFAQSNTVPNVVQKPMTGAQNALFNGGVVITGSGSAGTQQDWWSMNKVWALPVGIVVGAIAVIAFIVSLFRRRR